MAQIQVPIQADNMSTSLYIGDLDLHVKEEELYNLFNRVGQIMSVRICRDINTRNSLGYAYVNFVHAQNAADAIEMLNFAPMNGKPIRIMFSRRDPSLRRSGFGNLYVKNLHEAIDNRTLHSMFKTFGNIMSSKVATDPTGRSKGFGFVQFDTAEAALEATEKMNGMVINGKEIYVGPFKSRNERGVHIDVDNKPRAFTNVYVKNLGDAVTEDDLKSIFGEFGPMTSVVVIRRPADGKSRRFGFVNFENQEDAARAVEGLNGKKFGGSNVKWYVSKAQRKAERKAKLRETFKDASAGRFRAAANLYVTNMDRRLGENELKEFFSPFGTIISCKVLRNDKGASKRSGFVAFSTPGEANRAMRELDGKVFGNRPVYVSIARDKDDRRARHQAQSAEMNPEAWTPAVAPGIPQAWPPAVAFGIPVGRPRGQPMFYAPQPPFVPQPSYYYGNGYYGYPSHPQQFVPGIRSWGQSMPHHFVPMVPQGQQGPNGRQQFYRPPSPPPFMHQRQMLPRGPRGYRQPSGRGMPDGGPVAGPSAGRLNRPVPIGALVAALENATPHQQMNMLGENLYPLVEQLEPGNAGKVTGMLLEMHQQDVLHLLESPEELRGYVAEAMDVLRRAAPGDAGAGAAEEQVSSPPPNDSIAA